MTDLYLLFYECLNYDFFLVTHCYTDGLELLLVQLQRPSSKLKSTVKGSVQTQNKTKMCPKEPAEKSQVGEKLTDANCLTTHSKQWQEIYFKSHSQVSYPISFLSRVWNTSDLKIHFVCKIPTENLSEHQHFIKIIFLQSKYLEKFSQKSNNEQLISNY